MGILIRLFSSFFCETVQQKVFFSTEAEPGRNNDKMMEA